MIKINQLTMDSVTDAIPMSKYPRPSMVRDSYMSLNGKWDDGVVVPYPLESKNSQFTGTVPNEYEYHRTFTVEKGFIKDKLLLHFGAVDEVADVYIDGKIAGHHEGGYLPFTLDITELTKEETAHTLTVKVTDNLSHVYPYGKQKKNRGGMWYTPVTGIWQSVWLESVPKDYIEAIEITPYLDKISVNVYSEAESFEVSIFYKGSLVYEGGFDEKSFIIPIENAKLWSPEEPNLYDIVIRTYNDEIESYFGLRTVSIAKVDGVKRILLNEKPYFFNGVLDQGYFPEGIFTPNTEADYEADILRLKKLGINTIRKHIKIEPECFYEACDRLGMVVFQDCVNNGDYKFFRDTVYPTFISKKKDDTKFKVDDEIKFSFEQHMEGMLVHLYNFPCIVYYTIFNEGWGQFDSDILYNIVKAMDHTRIIDSTSGWFWQSESDVDSHHIYFKPVKLKKSDRPIIVSEFGGYSWKVSGHSFNEKNNYGYGTAKSKEELTKMIERVYREEIIPEIKNGLCGTIYTQITDVEDETNGFYTYDRKVCKVDEAIMQAISKELKI